MQQHIVYFKQFGSAAFTGSGLTNRRTDGYYILFSYLQLLGFHDIYSKTDIQTGRLTFTEKQFKRMKPISTESLAGLSRAIGNAEHQSSLAHLIRLAINTDSDLLQIKGILSSGASALPRLSEFKGGFLFDGGKPSLSISGEYRYAECLSWLLKSMSRSLTQLDRTLSFMHYSNYILEFCESCIRPSFVAVEHATDVMKELQLQLDALLDQIKNIRNNAVGKKDFLVIAEHDTESVLLEGNLQAKNCPIDILGKLLPIDLNEKKDEQKWPAQENGLPRHILDKIAAEAFRIESLQTQGGSVYDGAHFGVCKITTTRKGEDELPRPVLHFGRSRYSALRVVSETIHKHDDELGKSLSEHLGVLSTPNKLHNPPYGATHSTALQLIVLTKEKNESGIIFAKRSDSVGESAGAYSITVDEGVNFGDFKPTQKISIEPDQYGIFSIRRVGVRGMDEELGVLIEEGDINFLGLAYYHRKCAYAIHGYVELCHSYDYVRRQLSNRKDSFEQSYFLSDFTLESVFNHIYDEQKRWSRPAIIHLYQLLCIKFGSDKVLEAQDNLALRQALERARINFVY
ncbi:hypothetical protein MCEMSE15_00068 [Fimbriimonadaceae bacterium]